MSQADMKNSGQPWKTDNWYVSSWNYLDEVTKGFKPPKSVKIHDITLRDGEQQGNVMNFDGFGRSKTFGDFI